MTLVDDLANLLSAEKVSVNPTVLWQHSKDESLHQPVQPDVVVFPENAQDVSAVLRYANKHKIPVVPYGVGSGLEGQVIPCQGGISIDFQNMNQILEVSPQDFLVRIQPGITRMQLNKELKKYGLFFSVDPGADATLGGMVATNASGTTSVRYGGMRDLVRELEVVLADGTIIQAGGKAPKSSSGYHLTGLFVGSEGTLGVFTELTLQVYGIPEATLAARAVFANVDQAVKTAVAIMSAGVSVARMELVDSRSIQQVNLFSGTNYQESPTLFLEFHGNEGALETEIVSTQKFAEEEDCLAFQFETDSKEKAKLWEARHNLIYAFMQKNPGKKLLLTDVCVPVSELAAAVDYSRSVIDESGLDGAVVGHIGDGNFHSGVVFTPGNQEEIEKAERINELIVEDALRRGGTCTGEHGVGLGKKKYQAKEHKDALTVMQGIKHLLDPNGILNPGKIFE